MKKIFLFSGVVSLLLCGTLSLWFLGCARKTPTLYLYNWADYIAPELVSQFERLFQCKVVIDTFDSNEAMLAKLEAGARGYDLIFPTYYMAQLMQEKGLLQPIQKEKIPNLKNVDPDFLRDLAVDKEMAYAVPYMIGSTGIAYRKDKVADFEPSWKMFERSDLKGRMTLLNDAREVLAAALMTLGYSINTRDETQLKEAAEIVKRWKAQIAKFDAEAYKPGIASGEFVLVHGYSGDILQVQEEQEEVVFVYPREGFVIGCDCMCVPTGAQQVELAHAFINFLHAPANAAKNTEFVYFLCPNAPSYPLLSDEIKQNPGVFISKNDLKRAQVMEHLGADIGKYNKVWDEIKSGR